MELPFSRCKKELIKVSKMLSQRWMMSAPHWKMCENFLSHPMELIKLMGTYEGGMLKAPHWVQKMHVPVLRLQELIKVLITAGFTPICKKELIKVLIMAGAPPYARKSS